METERCKLKFRWKTFWALFFVFSFCECSIESYYSNGIVAPVSSETHATEFTENVVSDRKLSLERKYSPYMIRNDIIIDSNAELVIEPGVQLLFAPMVGITVKGILTAKGNEDEEIVFTSMLEQEKNEDTLPPLVRLVDGPIVNLGRLQVFHKGRWRSVCTNSRNWTRADMSTVCRQLGFQGGSWWKWIDKENGAARPRFLLEEPACRGTETAINECSNWSNRQLGSGVCDYHPDIGIECITQHENRRDISGHWRGIYFHNARSDRVLTQENTLYVKKSRSILSYANIKYAGSGRDYYAKSALHIEGVPPELNTVSITFSTYNGLNVTDPGTPFIISNCSFISNKGYGVYINSSIGGALLDNCRVEENGADGVKYVHHDSEIIDRTELLDFCTFPMTTSQTFPLTMAFEQSILTPKRECYKYFFTRSDQVITLHFQQMVTDINDTAKIHIYDGTSISDRLLFVVNIRNGTKPQSINTLRNNIFIKFFANTSLKLFATVKMVSSYRRWSDLIIKDSTIADNNGRGVGVENIRSQLYIKRTSISNNNHIAGVHVLGGTGYINITNSRISFNLVDGVNISHTGGSRNISMTSISSNKGYGISVWLNDSIDQNHVATTQETIVEYSEIFKNIDTGILVGNFCGNSIVNVTGNSFNRSMGSCIEIKSCWKKDEAGIMKIQIGNNIFVDNDKLGIKLKPLVNSEGVIEYNRFLKHKYGTILVNNLHLNDEVNLLPCRLTIKNNEFYDNRGIYVVNVGLSPYSEQQKLLFTWNYLKDNKIQEPFELIKGGQKLVPRSRVAAVVVVSSENCDIYRNILQNHESKYEIGSHLEDQSQIINCTFNWLGYSNEEKIFSRLFHRKDRYNLAKIEYLPYLLHSSNPAASTIMAFSTYVPEFQKLSSRTIGGEVDGLETLHAGEYFVERDINVRPGGRLSLEPGVTLKFPPSIGLMVAGKLEARGRGPNDIRFTLNEERVDALFEVTNETDVGVAQESSIPVRLLGGRTEYEGRLQVKMDGKWGTICNYGWTIEDASLVCNQLGLILNPNDWSIKRGDVPYAGSSDPIILSNVKCTDEDLDITKCKAEGENDFENSCTHEEDVGIRCYEPKWAGLRFGVLAERSNLQFITIELAGLADYAINELKPALQIDFNKHALENVRINNNLEDGLGILYSDQYSTESIVKNSEFVNNRGSGVSIKQLGLKMQGCTVSENKEAGIRHNPSISGKQQRELSGWFKPSMDVVSQYAPYIPLFIPNMEETIEIAPMDTKYFITNRLQSNIKRTFYIKATNGYVLGIQLLNRIHNQSSEEIIITDSQVTFLQGIKWNLKTDLNVFPTISRSYGIIMEYSSGDNALGNAVLTITSIPAPHPSKIPSFVPTLTITQSRIKNNKRGIWNSYYNRYLSDYNDHYLRKNNETISLINCELSYNEKDALFLQTPFWDVLQSNLSEITIYVNNSMIAENGRGIYQYSRDLRNSNNLFHFNIHGNVIERNKNGGFEVSLPYVWHYNENYTHSIVLQNNTWSDNKEFALIVEGHYAQFNVSLNTFQNNLCKDGLISLRGMEKSMDVKKNKIQGNKAKYIIEFKADSQSEIRGELRAIFTENILTDNSAPNPNEPSSLIVFDGLQKVRIRRNLFASSNFLSYALVAGLRTARIDSKIDVTENWWGSIDALQIKRKIFDFDDWNNHALAVFMPFLIENDLDSPLSVSWEQPIALDLDNISGRLTSSLTLHKRAYPYSITSDITIMPGVVLTIMPGVVMEFAPKIGILVLGTLKAKGMIDEEIIMRPSKRKQSVQQVHKSLNKQLRLRTHDHHQNMTTNTVEGFLEYWNTTTLQWVPLCDPRFTEQNAQVVCRQLGLPTLNSWVSHGRRYEFPPNSLTRIWSWPEPLQCTGDEINLDACPVRLNGQMHGILHTCSWDSDFVFIHCEDGKLDNDMDYWGGIRFAGPEFESSNYEDRIHDSVTHETTRATESTLQHVQIIGAGILHYHKSPSILAVRKSPDISNVNITSSASHGISFISPEHDVKLLFNRIEKSSGIGITIASLTGEARESLESSYTPAERVEIPFNTFSMLDICDPSKEFVIQERIMVYYKYTNSPATCIKIFHSAYLLKHFGFRFLQFNLFNQSDTISIYDGSIYNISSPHLFTISTESNMEKHFIKTLGPTISIKMTATGASQHYGFIAEIVTLPISAIGFNRDVQHNISYSVFNNNWAGGLHYVSAGEVNPSVTFIWNQFTNNCIKMYGNFTSCPSTIMLDLQNTQNLHFRNNLVSENQGGLWIHADSGGSATTLKARIHNNLFSKNKHYSTVVIKGRNRSPYHDVVLYRNYWINNYSPFHNVITLYQVVSNFTYNYIQNNIGSHILEVSGFEKVRLPIYQTTSHNGFYWNYAQDRDRRGTIIAGTPGQHYIDNVLYNPENDYEIVTVNRSAIDELKTPIDATYNYWGYNESLAVSGRIRDYVDQESLLEVKYRPYHATNSSILDGKCPPGWNMLSDTCYKYIAVPMTFFKAREFCMSANSSMPYVMGNYGAVYKFLKSQDEFYTYDHRVWIQHIDMINRCTVFLFQSIEEDQCWHLHPFICEMDPKVVINPLSWKNDIISVAVFSSVLFAILLLAILMVFWYSKSKHRHVERLQRRNSIRQSLNSLRSISSSQAGFSDLGYKRKALSSHQSNPTIITNSDYKKMNGSVDSMEKSQFNSSLEEDSQSYDIYETHNLPVTQSVNPSQYDLSFRNEGFRDNSTFASRDDATWRSSDYINNSSTLPLTTTLGRSDSSNTILSKSEKENEYQIYYERPKSSMILETNLDEPGLPPVPPPRSKSEVLLETNFDYISPSQDRFASQSSTFHPATRSKSQPLETAM